MASLQNNPIFKSSLERPSTNSIKVRRNNDIFFSLDNKLYVSNSKRDSQVTELLCDLIDFSIFNICINKTGEYLCVYGKFGQIVIIVVPFDFAAEKYVCKGFLLDSFHLTRSPSTKIVKIEWHPLSDSNSHLVVLTSNGYLRLYNVVKDLVEPEISIRVKEENGQPDEIGNLTCSLKRISFGFFGNEAVDFEFGQSNELNPWSIFSVFVLFKNGDLFIVSPFLPTSYRLDQKSLQLLSESCLDSFTSRWMEETRKTAQIVSSNQVKLSLPNSISHIKPSPIGPVLFEPDGGSSQLEEDVSALLYVPGKIEVLAVSFTSGRIDFYLLVDSIYPSFCGNVLERSYSLYLFETVLLAEKGVDKLSVKLYCDPVNLFQVFAVHSSGIHLIQLDWMKEICVTKDSNDFSPSKAILITSFKISCSITGVCILFDSQSGYNLLALDSFGKLLSFKFPFSLFSRPSKTVEMSSISAESSLKAYPFDLFYKENMNNGIVPKFNRISDKSCVFDETKSTELVKLSCELRKNFIDYGKAIAEEIEGRLDLMRKEMDFQKEKVTLLSSNVSNMQQKRLSLISKIRLLESQTESLCSKADAVLKKSSKAFNRLGSPEEEQLCQAVSSANDLVEGLKSRIATVNEFHNS